MIVVKHNGVAHKVPCDKCAFCLQNKRSAWMFRIHHEMRNQEYRGWFLTLTYDQRHVPRTASGRLSLRFRDVQLYLKRLRKLKYYCKYICVGEYGGETDRPHYHMLLWTDAPVSVLEEEWKSSKDGTRMGNIHFGSITMQSAMYCLKYIIQPKVRMEDEVDCFGRLVPGREKTRAQFSRGLGLSYLTADVYEWHTSDYDNPEMFSYIDGRKVGLPRYYKQKIFTKYQLAVQQSKVYWDSIRERRKYMRELIAKGIKNTKVYIQSLRVENARRIIEKTKYGTKL